MLLDLTAILSTLQDLGVTIPRGALAPIGWCLAGLILLLLLALASLVIAFQTFALRLIVVGVFRLRQPVKSKQAKSQVVKMIRAIRGADKR